MGSFSSFRVRFFRFFRVMIESYGRVFRREIMRWWSLSVRGWYFLRICRVVGG